jgi:hypothetical protein
VAPTLKLLFSAEEIQDLARTYASLASAPAAAHEDGIEGDGQFDNPEDEEEAL